MPKAGRTFSTIVREVSWPDVRAHLEAHGFGNMVEAPWLEMFETLRAMRPLYRPEDREAGLHVVVEVAPTRYHVSFVDGTGREVWYSLSEPTCGERCKCGGIFVPWVAWLSLRVECEGGDAAAVAGCMYRMASDTYEEHVMNGRLYGMLDCGFSNDELAAERRRLLMCLANKGRIERSDFPNHQPKGAWL